MPLPAENQLFDPQGCLNRSILRPFRQGNLDRFCGIYAILNAINFAASEPIIDHNDATAAFSALVMCATENTQTDMASFRGIKSQQLVSIARAALYGMQAAGHYFSLREPRYLFRKPGEAELTKRNIFKRAAAAKQAALIIRVQTFDCSHWSVMRRMEGNTVWLFDSARIEHQPIKHCRPWRVVVAE